MKGQDILFSQKTDEWSTPDYIFNWLNEKYGFTLDPCASDSNHKCAKYYTIETNGLEKSWKDEVVFINPPYSEISSWVKKAHDECLYNDAKCVSLIPARTDTKYFHEYIMNGAKNLYLIKGRLKFGNSKNCAPFPSCVVEFENLYLSNRIYNVESDLRITVAGIDSKELKNKYDNNNQ